MWTTRSMQNNRSPTRLEEFSSICIIFTATPHARSCAPLESMLGDRQHALIFQYVYPSTIKGSIKGSKAEMAEKQVDSGIDKPTKYGVGLWELVLLLYFFPAIY